MLLAGNSLYFKTMSLKLKTTEGVSLHVSVGWNKSYQQEPVIRFHFDNQQLCSSYFISTFLEIPDGQGLCLDGDRYNYKSISADLVRDCKCLIETAHLKTSN